MKKQITGITIGSITRMVLHGIITGEEARQILVDAGLIKAK